MSTLSIRLSDQELTLFKNYAKFYNKSLSEVIRNTMIEKIEDEYDLAVFAEYEKDITNGTLETVSHEEMKKQFGL